MFFPLMATEVRVKTVLFWNGGLAGIQQVGELRNAQIPLPLKLRVKMYYLQKSSQASNKWGSTEMRKYYYH